jgi:hypothetical protein
VINSSPKFGGAYIAKSRNADTPNLKILNLAFESGSSEISRLNTYRLPVAEASLRLRMQIFCIGMHCAMVNKVTATVMPNVLSQKGTMKSP